MARKSAVELCQGFYNFIKKSGRKSASLEEYKRSQDIKSRLHPGKIETLSSDDLRIIRSALSSGHHVFTKLKLYGYKRDEFKKLNTIYKIVD